MGSSSAWALAFTIDGPDAGDTTVFSFGNGVKGKINPVFDLSGSTICLNGTCTSPVAQDWLLVSITLDSDSDPVSEIGMSAVLVSPVVGVGYLSGSGEVPTGGSGSGTTQGLFAYGYPSTVVQASNLQASETTVRLFIAFDTGKLPGTFASASFMIRETGSSLTDSPPLSPIVVVPEPGTLLLLGGGLLGLGLAGRPRF